jgi:hypothetical protein
MEYVMMYVRTPVTTFTEEEEEEEEEEEAPL